MEKDKIYHLYCGLMTVRLKDPPFADKLPVSTFVIHKKRYKIDRTYQREAGTWEKWMRQYLIDTILRGLGMPPLCIHKKGKKMYVVDGQQRLDTIWRFKANKLELNEDLSSDIIERNNGKATYGTLSQEFQNRFDSYPINVVYLEDYDDNEIREMFKRLQTGKPLTPGEKINAYPGKIVPVIRSLSQHRFFDDIISVGRKRFRHYFLLAQLLFLEEQGISDISTRYIFNFLDTHKRVDPITLHHMKKTLNFMTRAFGTRRGELSRPGWIISTYLLTSQLVKNYNTNGQPRKLKKFLSDYYQKVMVADSTNKELNRFRLLISKSTTGADVIKRRHEIMMRQYIAKNKPKMLDENRFFTYQQKVIIFNKYKEKCQICSTRLKFGDRKTHYHHKEHFIQAGETKVENALLVCKTCHLKRIHGTRRNR